MLCAMGTAALCKGSCCFIYVLYSVYCRMYCALGTAILCLCLEHCCFICCMLCILRMFYSMGTAVLKGVCCVLQHVLCCKRCHFMPSALLLHILYAVYILSHVLCLKHCCFVARALLLHMLYAVYCRMFCAKCTAASYIVCCIYTISCFVP